MTLTHKIDEKTLSLFKVISKLAYDRFEDIYVVGGYPRDLLLSLPNKDLDFVILGNAIEFANDLATRLNIAEYNVVTFPKYGTVKMSYEDTDLEFVTARKESYSADSRKPEVSTGTLRDDLVRRDFTINTMCISLNRADFGELVDLLNGRDDLKTKVLKTPKDSRLTFSDDPLRIMRLARFASKLGFIPLEQDLLAANLEIDRLKIVSKERISDEFLKILQTKKPSIGLIILDAIGALNIIFPELVPLKGQEQRPDYHTKDVWKHTLEVLDNVAELTDNLWVRFAALVHDIGKPKTKLLVDGVGWTFHGHEEAGREMIKPIFRNMKLPLLENLELVQKLVDLHGRFRVLQDPKPLTDSAIRRFLVNAHPYLNELIILCSCDYSTKNNIKLGKIEEGIKLAKERIKTFLEKENLRDGYKDPVSGFEIMEIYNLKPGAEVGKIKGKIKEAVLSGEIVNTHEAGIEFLNKLKELDGKEES